MATRDLAKEQAALKTFGSATGRMPKTPEDWALLHKYAYGSDIPAELQAQTNASLSAAGITQPSTITTNPLSQTVEGSNLAALKQGVTTAKTAVQQTSQPSTALNILQEALKAKTGTATMPLGESKVFEKAGVGGIGALAASLQARGKEMEMNRADFINVVNGMAGQYKDAANLALNQYNMAVSEYNTEAERLQQIVNSATEHQRAIELLEKKAQIDKDLASYSASIEKDLRETEMPSVEEQVELLKGGYKYEGGVVSKDTKIINGYDFRNYATDPNWGVAVSGILSSLPSISTTADIDNYIKSVAPASKITGSDVATVANKYGVEPEMILAVMQHESNLGTSNVALKNNNFGGMTWTGKNGERGTARPAAEGGYYVKYPTVESGLDAWVRNIAGRKTATQTAAIEPIEWQKAANDVNNTWGNTEIAKQYDKLYGYYSKLNSIWDMYNSASRKDPQGTDQAIGMLFNKMLDENSIVRESEFERVGSDLGLVGQSIAEIKKNFGLTKDESGNWSIGNGGQAFTDDLRKRLVEISNQLMQSTSEDYAYQAKNFVSSRDILGQYGFTPEILYNYGQAKNLISQRAGVPVENIESYLAQKYEGGGSTITNNTSVGKTQAGVTPSGVKYTVE